MPHDNLPNVDGPMYTVVINVLHDGQPVQPQLSFAAPAEMLKDNLLGVWRGLDWLLPMSAKAGASAPVDELPPSAVEQFINEAFPQGIPLTVQLDPDTRDVIMQLGRYANVTIAQLRAEISVVEYLARGMETRTAPCGHLEKYAYTTDGGKTCSCYVCDLTAMTEDRDLWQADHGDDCPYKEENAQLRARVQELETLIEESMKLALAQNTAYEDFGKAWDAVRGHANNANDVIDDADKSRTKAADMYCVISAKVEALSEKEPTR